MFKNILMPTDGSAHSEKAIERGIALAQLCGAKVIGIHVVPNYRLTMSLADEAAPDAAVQDEIEDAARSRAAHFLGFVHQSAATAGVPCQTLVATNDHPYDAIVNAASAHGCDLIVMTSRCRKRLASLLMSSESDRVLHRASIPVLVCRALVSADKSGKSPLKRVLPPAQRGAVNRSLHG
jgi:nucleotide-binding universal stress UspA family protein